MRKQVVPRIVEDLSDSEDEEIPEDEAFNSDDERKYGAFFENEAEDEGDESDDDDDDDNDDDESDDEEEEGDGGQYMLDLLNRLDSTNDGKEEAPKHSLAANVKESEFASAVVRGANLTLDSLMEGLEDTKGFGVMQKTLKEVSRGKAASAPASRIVTERARRKVQYEDQSKEVSLWLEAVQENRRAETLDFRQRERIDILTKNRLVDKFVPTTDFEKQVQAALQEAGEEDEKAMAAKEARLFQEDDLGSNQLTMEDYKKRHGELAKMRALMFYHEQKRHHINKIKSKKYRRIRKRQRERLKEAEMNAQVEENPDLAQELEEKEEIERMRERMTLAHKNTSKWAKRVLKRGKNVDMETRRALSAQLQRGQDLRRKMNSLGDRHEDESDNDEDLVDTARRVLESTENESEDPKVKTGLFKLSFMQKGIEKQREKAKEEARRLLQELEANKTEAEDETEKEVEEQQKKKKRKKVASKEEMKRLLGDDKLTVDIGVSTSLALTGGIEIDLGVEGEDQSTASSTKSSKTLSSVTSNHQGTIEIKPANKVVKETQKKGANRKTSKASSMKELQLVEEEDSNPWLAAAAKNDHNQTQKTEKPSKEGMQRKSGVRKSGIVDVEGAVDLLTEKDDDDDERKLAKDADAKKPTTIAELSQEELVKRAFAGPSEEEVDGDFAKEKAQAVERDNESRKKKRAPLTSATTSGWGCWAGLGAPPPKPPKKLPKKLQPPLPSKPKRERRDEKMPNVIINEKRIKKTANHFQIAHIPHPYSSREEYERAMRGAIGREWNVTSSFKDMTRPEILTRAVIELDSCHLLKERRT